MPKRAQRKHLAWVALSIILLAAAMGSYFVVAKLLDKQPKKSQTSDAITYSTDTPSEQKPDKKTYKWAGAQNDPKYISIPSTGTEGFLQNVGVDQNKAVAVPNNIYLAGWFNQTPRPGEPGNSVIDGHVTGRVNKGIFEKLTSAKVADIITIEFGDGSTKRFQIVKSVAVPTKDAPAVIFSQEAGIDRQLTLVTCTGAWDAKINQYTERLIVIAKAI